MKPLPFFRKLNLEEKDLLVRLLSAKFPGSSELQCQVGKARVRTIDENGSLAFLVSAASSAEVERRIPVEGYCEDSDGVMIHFLVHVLDGTLSELEIFKEDNSRLMRVPSVNQITLLVL